MRGLLNVKLRSRSGTSRTVLQRSAALFFVVVMLVAAFGPTISVYALDHADSTTLTPLGESPETVADAPDDKLNQPDALVPATQPEILPADAEERTVKQDEYSETVLNQDGTYTQTVHQTQQRYKEDGEWVDVDTSIVKDASPYPKTNTIQRLWNNVWSFFGDSQTLTVAQNQWQARFAPTDHDRPTVEIEDGGRRFSIEPRTDRAIVPRVDTDERGVDFVVYDDIWPGVNLVYEVRAQELKEYIVVKDRSAQRSFEFNISNVTLEEDPEVPGAYIVKETGGAIAPLNVSVWGQGLVFGDEYVGQTLDGNKLTVSLNSEWVDALADGNFPLSIDPTYTSTRGNFGTRASGNYHSFKSDGAQCDNLTCYPQVGSLLQSGGYYRWWRALIKPDYIPPAGSTYVSANLHLSKMPANASNNYMGTTANRTIWATWATDWSFNCCNNGSVPRPSTVVGTVGDIDVTGVYKYLLDNGYDPNGSWLGLYGEEGSIESFKAMDPNDSYVTFQFSGQAVAPTHAAPADKKVLVTTQPSLRGNTTTDPNGDSLQYRIDVYTDPGAVVKIASSGTMSTPQWTVPQGVLQDGVTYYWKVFARDYSSLHTGSWVASSATRSFKVDLRNGKDSTQSYDSAGPVNVDLATGNVTTSAGSHSIAALGGSIGIGLEYNTPTRSLSGAVAEYWDNNSLTGSPKITRAEENVDFSWLSGSPAPGVIGNDNFSARFTTYFASPVSGSIQLGATFDDGVRIWADDQLILDKWTALGTFYGTAINVTAGQVVKIKMEYREAISTATAKLLVRGIGADQTIPSKWLQTGPRPVSDQGLTARYYTDDGSHVFDESRFFMQRKETKIDTDWGNGSPVVNGPTDNFMVRYTGYFIAPSDGTYSFGAGSDDGSRIYLNGSSTPHANNWNGGAWDEVYGSAVTLTKGQVVPIKFEFYEVTSTARVGMYVKMNGATTAQLVQPNWLTTEAPVLPDGWDLSMGSGGSLSYDFARILSHAVTLYDATGSTHEYKWDTAKNNYTPPEGEAGTLVRNGDGSVTLQDVDGRTYVFNADGTLREVISPVDDRNPAALKYEYGGTPSRLKKIVDGVDASRSGELFYEGATECGAPPDGYSDVPSSMLCAFVTTDGQVTRFHYNSDKRLAQIELPGGTKQDYGYDTDGRLTSVRDSLANDAIAANVRNQGETVATQITYDILGRAQKVTLPAATDGAVRLEATYNYFTSNDPTYFGAAELHKTLATEPNGYSQRIEYDDSLRTVKSYDKAGLVTQTQWDSAKDLVLSTTDPLGQKSTTIYDYSDRPIESYGPAPAAWFDSTTRKPLAANASQVPRTDAVYDGNIKGLEAKYYSYATTGKTLFGTPKLHGTGITGTAGTISKSWSTAPIRSGKQGWGIRLTGRIKLAEIGTHTFRIESDDGARLYINDQRVLSDWGDGAFRAHPDGTFTTTTASNAANGGWYPIRLDYYNKSSSETDAQLKLSKAVPGSTTFTTSIGSLLTPDYGLATSTTSYDSTVGNTTIETNYGTNPELGLAQSVAVDPTGLNLATTATYETAGATDSFLRQTNKTLPGGNTTTYGYYTATETRDNPCTPETEAFKQAGFMKTKTEPDPDGAGVQASRTSETIYDAAGRTVASRFNNDPWTCATYDDRGRVTQAVVPDINGRTGRTVTTNYSYQGSPLKVQVVDSVAGTTVSEIDLLGRAVSSTDTFGNVSAVIYDDQGRVASKVTPLGTESYTYDTYDRATEYKVDDTTYATVTYDTYSRVQDITYNQAKDASDNKLKLEQIKRDLLQRTTGAVFRFSDGTAFDETVTRTQIGRVTAYTDAYGGSSATGTYSYDKAGRLTAATIDNNTYSYGYNTPTGCIGTYNPSANKNSNRTTFTANGVTTTYCYDYADRLTSSSDVQLGTPTYDDHGNTVSLAGNGTPITFTYDASDSNTAIQQGDYKVEYLKTATGSVLRKKEYQNNELTKSYRYLAGGAVLQSCNLADDNDCTATDKYLSLPGGTTLTLSPTNPDETKRVSYSIKNFHGDTAITANEQGAPTSSVFLYEPFGQAAASTTFGTNSNPTNATDQSMGWATDPTRKVQSGFTLALLQMGARVYLPTAGRFLQVDPIEGGTPNAYVYTPDPINGNDYSGLLSVVNSSFSGTLTVGISTGMQPHAATPLPSATGASTPAQYLQPTAPAARTQGPGSMRSTSGTAGGPPASWKKPTQSLRGINSSEERAIAGIPSFTGATKSNPNLQIISQGCATGVAEAAVWEGAAFLITRVKPEALAVTLSYGCMTGASVALYTEYNPTGGKMVENSFLTYDSYRFLLQMIGR